MDTNVEVKPARPVAGFVSEPGSTPSERLIYSTTGAMPYRPEPVTAENFIREYVRLLKSSATPEDVGKWLRANARFMTKMIFYDSTIDWVNDLDVKDILALRCMAPKGNVFETDEAAEQYKARVAGDTERYPLAIFMFGYRANGKTDSYFLSNLAKKYQDDAARLLQVAYRLGLRDNDERVSKYFLKEY